MCSNGARTVRAVRRPKRSTCKPCQPMCSSPCASLIPRGSRRRGSLRFWRCSSRTWPASRAFIATPCERTQSRHGCRLRCVTWYECFRPPRPFSRIGSDSSFSSRTSRSLHSDTRPYFRSSRKVGPMTQSPIFNPLPLVSLDETSEFPIPDGSAAAARPEASTASGLVVVQRPAIEPAAAARPERALGAAGAGGRNGA